MSDYLCNELMMEILARLPVRTLLQIRCVCKSWCSLVSSDNFTTFFLNRTTHLNNINNTHLLLIRHFTEDIQDNGKQERFSLYLDNESLTEYHLNLEIRPITRIRPYFRILGSCNGLVCLIDCRTRDSICLWNPTIRKLVVLPEIRITFGWLRSYGSYGYGFDSATNDYKVVRIAYVHGGPEVDIYSLKEGCWRQISPAGHIPIIPFGASYTSVNGAIHWLCGDRRPCIVSFNLGSEEFSLIELPRSLGQSFVVPVHRLSIGVFQDSLCVLHNDCVFQDSLFVLDDDFVEEGVASIWVMKQYGVVESWTNEFNLDTYGDFVKVLGLRRNGDVLLTKDDELFSVDINTENLKSLGISGAFCVNTYTESLVLIDKVNGGFGEPAWSSQLQAL